MFEWEKYVENMMLQTGASSFLYKGNLKIKFLTWRSATRLRGSTLIVRFIPPPRGVYTPLVLAGVGAEGAEKHWILGPWGLYPLVLAGSKTRGYKPDN